MFLYFINFHRDRSSSSLFIKGYVDDKQNLKTESALTELKCAKNVQREPTDLESGSLFCTYNFILFNY